MSTDVSIATRTENRIDILGYHYGPGENTCKSFSHNPNYITDKLLCNKLRKLLRIKIVHTIIGIVLVIPILIAVILVVRHLMM